MRGALPILIVGAIAGAIFASTPQGKKVVDDVKKKAKSTWEDPNVQNTVSDIQGKVRDNVPYVGEDIADAIGRVKPAKQ